MSAYIRPPRSPHWHIVNGPAQLSNPDNPDSPKVFVTRCGRRAPFPESDGPRYITDGRPICPKCDPKVTP